MHEHHSNPVGELPTATEGLPSAHEHQLVELADGDEFGLYGAGRFLILARDGVVEPNLVWKDTVLVRTAETVDILLEVTNPGRWMAHWPHRRASREQNDVQLRRRALRTQSAKVSIPSMTAEKRIE